MRTAIGRTAPLAELDELRRRPFFVAIFVALALAAVCAQTLPGAALDRQPRIRAIRAKADAFVSGANVARNFGGSPDLRLDASPTARAFIRFRVDVQSGEVQRINLLLYSRTRSKVGYQVRLVEEPWREREITYRNAPSLSPDFVLSGKVKAQSWKAVDVTSLVEDASADGGDYISFALTTRSENALELASRETGLHGPRLVVERVGGEGRGKAPGLPTRSGNQPG
jgi:hypothetical protein